MSSSSSSSRPAAAGIFNPCFFSFCHAVNHPQMSMMRYLFTTSTNDSVLDNTHVAWCAAYTTERGMVRSTRPSRSTTALLRHVSRRCLCTTQPGRPVSPSVTKRRRAQPFLVAAQLCGRNLGGQRPEGGLAGWLAGWLLVWKSTNSRRRSGPKSSKFRGTSHITSLLFHYSVRSAPVVDLLVFHPRCN